MFSRTQDEQGLFALSVPMKIKSRFSGAGRRKSNFPVIDVVKLIRDSPLLRLFQQRNDRFLNPPTRCIHIAVSLIVVIDYLLPNTVFLTCACACLYLSVFLNAAFLFSLKVLWFT